MQSASLSGASASSRSRKRWSHQLGRPAVGWFLLWTGGAVCRGGRMRQWWRESNILPLVSVFCTMRRPWSKSSSVVFLHLPLLVLQHSGLIPVSYCLENLHFSLSACCTCLLVIFSVDSVCRNFSVIHHTIHQILLRHTHEFTIFTSSLSKHTVSSSTSNSTSSWPLSSSTWQSNKDSWDMIERNKNGKIESFSVWCDSVLVSVLLAMRGLLGGRAQFQLIFGKADKC